jgi:hypothetical protein
VDLDSILTLLSALGEIVVLGLLVRGKTWSTLPIFTFYMLWALATDLAGYLIVAKAPSSYPVFLLNELKADAFFQFLVLVELAWATLRPVRKSLPRATPYLIAVLIAISAAIVWPLVGKTVPPHFDADTTLQYHLQTTTAVLRVGLFLVMAGGSQLLSIGWHDRELQVATGLGIYSIVSLIVSVMHTHGAPPDEYHMLDQIQVGSYLVGLSYWVFSFATKEQERKEFSPQMQHLLLQMGVGVRSDRVTLSQIPTARPRKKD